MRASESRFGRPGAMTTASFGRAAAESETPLEPAPLVESRTAEESFLGRMVSLRLVSFDAGIPCTGDATTKPAALSRAERPLNDDRELSAKVVSARASGSRPHAANASTPRGTTK